MLGRNDRGIKYGEAGKTFDGLDCVAAHVKGSKQGGPCKRSDGRRCFTFAFVFVEKHVKFFIYTYRNKWGQFYVLHYGGA